jgi:predicted short-subunit dehydrogenase-like oxidoreductase (DUF2520 family)
MGKTGSFAVSVRESRCTNYILFSIGFMKKEIGPVAFIGAGNVAWHLAPALDNADFSVREVYGRDSKKVRQIVSRLYQAELRKSLDFADSAARIFILAVSDDAIESVAEKIILPPNGILVHTSGARPLNSLDRAGTSKIGVFYPLQTFSRGAKINFAETPILVESQSHEVEEVLMTMGKSISKTVFSISAEKRMALHLAAVFASNFTNHMLTIAFDLMQRNDLDVHWLGPLIIETINRSMSVGPEIAQTGPSRRGDLKTLQKHLELLKSDKKLREIYRLISQHILDKYQS